MPSFAVNWLMPRLARETMAGDETEGDIVDPQARPDLDCAIRLGRGPWPAGVPALPVGRGLSVASPDMHRDWRAGDLSRHVLIAPTTSRISGRNGFAGPAFTGARYKSFDNLQLIYEAAVAGMGIAIGLDPVVRPYLESGRLTPVPQTVTLSRSFHLVHRPERAIDRSYGRFRDWLFVQAA